MALRGGKLYPSSRSKILVCVDDYSGFDLSGRLYCAFDGKQYNYRSVDDMLDIMDQVFDAYAYPQPTHEIRSFRKRRRTAMYPKDRDKELGESTMNILEEKGQKSTFIVHVQFRQNATWQGTLQWVEGKREQHFRSTLELIRLMDDAIEQQQPE